MLIATMPKLETKRYLMIISYLSFKRIFNAKINENVFKSIEKKGENMRIATIPQLEKQNVIS